VPEGAIESLREAHTFRSLATKLGKKSGIDGMKQASVAAEEVTRMPVGKNWL
jgi:hypothetical protein